MKDLVDILLARRRAEEPYFRDYLGWSKKIKKIAAAAVGEVRAVVFGSILRPEETPRDIDLLLISPHFADSQKRREVKAKIWRKIGFEAPLELHLVTPEIYENWYRHFIKDSGLEI